MVAEVVDVTAETTVVAEMTVAEVVATVVMTAEVVHRDVSFLSILIYKLAAKQLIFNGLAAFFA